MLTFGIDSLFGRQIFAQRLAEEASFVGWKFRYRLQAAAVAHEYIYIHWHYQKRAGRLKQSCIICALQVQDVQLTISQGHQDLWVWTFRSEPSGPTWNHRCHCSAFQLGIAKIQWGNWWLERWRFDPTGGGLSQGSCDMYLIFVLYTLAL